MPPNLNLTRPDQMAQSHFGLHTQGFPWRVTQCESHSSRAVYCSDSKNLENGVVDLFHNRGLKEITTPLLLYGHFYDLLFRICWRNEAGTHTEMTAMSYISLLIPKIIHKAAAQTSLSRQPGCSVGSNNCEADWEGKSKGDSCLNLYWELHYMDSNEVAPVPLNWFQSAVRRLGITKMKQWCKRQIYWIIPLQTITTSQRQGLYYTHSSPHWGEWTRM